MISMRVPNEKVKSTLLTFLNEHQINNEIVHRSLNQCMIAEEGQEIIGFTSYAVSDGVYNIQQLFIKPSYRRKKIGDGLIRALLNLMDRKGIEEARIQINEQNIPFIEYVGLECMDSESLIYRAQLPAFFEGPCRGEREQ